MLGDLKRCGGSMFWSLDHIHNQVLDVSGGILANVVTFSIR